MRKKRTTTAVRSDYDARRSVDTTELRTETDAGIEAGEELARLKFAGTAIRIDGGRPYRITEDDKVASLEGFLLRPVSRRGTVTVYDAPSFIGYVNRFKSEASAVFSDKATATFTGILDYHEADADGDADWLRHRVALPLRKTRQWQIWEAANKQSMTQAAFAQFLEDNIPSIAQPDGATLVEIVRTLEAKKDVRFESKIDRQVDGSFKFFYAEDVQGAAGRGDIKIPSLFHLVLTPFEGSIAAAVEARFRFRVADGGKLSLWFELVRIEELLEAAFIRAEEEITAGIDDTFFVHGPAPAAQTTE